MSDGLGHLSIMIYLLDSEECTVICLYEHIYKSDINSSILNAYMSLATGVFCHFFFVS